MAKKVTYNEAIAEIESIIAKFNSEQFDVDKLASEVERATALITMCKDKLKKAEEDVAKVMKGEE